MKFFFLTEHQILCEYTCQVSFNGVPKVTGEKHVVIPDPGHDLYQKMKLHLLFQFDAKSPNFWIYEGCQVTTDSWVQLIFPGPQRRANPFGEKHICWNNSTLTVSVVDMHHIKHIVASNETKSKTNTDGTPWHGTHKFTLNLFRSGITSHFHQSHCSGQRAIGIRLFQLGL